MDRPGVRTGDAGGDRAAFRARRAGIDRHRFPAPCAAKAVAAAAAPAFLAGTPGKGGSQHPAWHPGPHRGKGTKRLAEMKFLEYLSDSVGNVRIAACFPAYAKTSRSCSSATRRHARPGRF